AMLFSSSPSDVCVVVPGQWWRIIGTSERLTTPNYKIFFNRAKFTQKMILSRIFTHVLFLYSPITKRQPVWLPFQCVLMTP
ncbi:MAG: hypothetical protein RR850_14480, partial [Hafnia sp.]